MEKIIQNGYIHYRLSDILKDKFLSENFGTFQVQNGMKNEELIIFVDKVFNDIELQKYKSNEINNDIFKIANIKKAYKLTYKTPFEWLSLLNIFVIETNDKNSLGYSLADEEDFTIFTKNKILHSGIIICNPEQNERIRNTIYHELKHMYRYFKIYSENFSVNNKDIIVCNNVNHNYLDLLNCNKIITSLNNTNITSKYVNLRNFLLECLYYLNDEEIAARQENLFCEFEDIILKNKNVSYENCLKLSKTYTLFNNIKRILEFCVDKRLFCDDNLNDKFLNEYIRKDINRFRKAFNKNRKNLQDTISLMFIYKKILKKINVALKHTKQIYDFLNL